VLQHVFHLPDIRHDHDQLVAAVYLQVSIVSQALIFVTRSRSWSFMERPGGFLMFAFCGAQLVSLHFISDINLLQDCRNLTCIDVLLLSTSFT
jgi:hypothetical protein